MKKKVITAALIGLCILFVQPGYAAELCVDFDDLSLGTTYVVGDNFVSSGVWVYHSPFQWSSGGWTSDGSSTVEAAGLAGGSGFDMMVNNINMYFIFGTPVKGLTLKFGEYGGNLNILINGAFKNFENFNAINSTNLGGVAISVINGPGSDKGTLTLTGTINEFAIGGQELYIDDVCVERTCKLDLSLSYAGGTLTMDFDLSTPEAATWNVWINNQSSNISIVSIPLPPIHSPISFPIQLPNFPSLGNIGVLTTLTTPTEGIICSDWETVDTVP